MNSCNAITEKLEMPADNSEHKPAAGDAEAQNSGLTQTLFGHRENQLSTHSEPRPTVLQISTLIAPSVQRHRSVPLEFSQTSGVLSEVHTSSVQHNFTQNSPNQFNQNQRNNNMSIGYSSHRSRISQERKWYRPRRSTPHPRRLRDEEVHSALPTQHESSNSEHQIAEPAHSKFLPYRKARMLSLSNLIIALMCIVLEAAFLVLFFRVKNNCSPIALFILQGTIISTILVILESIKVCLCRSKTLSPEQSMYSGTNPISSIENPVEISGTERSVMSGDYGMRYEKSSFHPTQFASNSVNRIIERHCCFNAKQVVLNVLATIFYFALIVVLLNGFFKVATESGKIENPLINNITSVLNSTDKRLQIMCRNSDLNIGMIYLVSHLASVMLRVIVCWCLGCGGCARVLMTKNKNTGAPRSLIPPTEAHFTSTLFPNRGYVFGPNYRRQRIGRNVESSNS